MNWMMPWTWMQMMQPPPPQASPPPPPPIIYFVPAPCEQPQKGGWKIQFKKPDTYA